MFLVGTLKKLWISVNTLNEIKPHCGVSIHGISVHWAQVATTTEFLNFFKSLE